MSDTKKEKLIKRNIYTLLLNFQKVTLKKVAKSRNSATSSIVYTQIVSRQHIHQPA